MNGILKTFLAVASLAVAPTFASADQTLIFGEAGPNRGARAESLKWLIGQIRERTDLEVQEQWAGALFKTSGALDGIGNRVADFGTIVASYNPTEMTGYTIADLPLGYSDPWVLMQAADELMRTSPEIQNQLENLNLVYIGTATTTGLDVGCKGKTITTLEDLEGVSIRVAGSYGRTLSDKYGVIPVNDSIYKAYQGLDTGLYDCSFGYAYVTKSLRWYEQFTSYTRMNWGQFGGLGVFMNADTWDDLGSENQAILTELGKGMTRHFGEAIQAATLEAYDLMEENGIEVLDITDTARSELLAASEPYIEEWVERADKSGIDGKALLAEFRGLLEKYEADKKANGYPWDS